MVTCLRPMLESPAAADEFRIERWSEIPMARIEVVSTSSSYDLIIAAWRAAQVLGLGPHLLLRNTRDIVESWRPVSYLGKRARPPRRSRGWPTTSPPTQEQRLSARLPASTAWTRSAALAVAASTWICAA